MTQWVKNGRLYDTDTAEELVYYRQGKYGDSYVQILYQKKNGEFFLHTIGGPDSEYSYENYDGEIVGIDDIMPLSKGRAENWAEDKIDAEKFQEIFGPVSEDGGDFYVSFEISSELVEKMRKYLQCHDQPYDEVIQEALDTYLTKASDNEGSNQTC